MVQLSKSTLKVIEVANKAEKLEKELFECMTEFYKAEADLVYQKDLEKILGLRTIALNTAVEMIRENLWDGSDEI